MKNNKRCKSSIWMALNYHSADCPPEDFILALQVIQGSRFFLNGLFVISLGPKILIDTLFKLFFISFEGRTCSTDESLHWFLK